MVLSRVSVQGVLVGEQDLVACLFEHGLEADRPGGVGVADADPADDELAVGGGANRAVPDRAAVEGRVEVVPVGGHDTVRDRGVGQGAVDPGRRGARAEDEEAVRGDGHARERLSVVAEAEGQRDRRLRVIGQRQPGAAHRRVHPGEGLLQEAVDGFVGWGDRGLWAGADLVGRRAFVAGLVERGDPVGVAGAVRETGVRVRAARGVGDRAAVPVDAVVGDLVGVVRPVERHLSVAGGCLQPGGDGRRSQIGRRGRPGGPVRVSECGGCLIGGEERLVVEELSAEAAVGRFDSDGRGGAVILGRVSVQGVLVGEHDLVARLFEDGLEADGAGDVGVADADPADHELAVGRCANAAVPDAAAEGGVEVVPVRRDDPVRDRCAGERAVDPGRGRAWAEDEEAVGGDGARSRTAARSSGS